MFTKTITYTDFNGVERKEDFYFNFTKAELMDMQLTTVGGMDAMIKRITSTQDIPALVKLFRELVLKAYGIKSDDGRRFIKNDQLREEFSQTQAFSDLYMELATDSKAASDFINKLIPADIDRKQLEEAKKQFDM